MIISWCHRHFRIIFIGGIFLFLGVVRYQLSLPKINTGHIAYYNDQSEVVFVGKVVAEPDQRIDNTKLTVEAITKYEHNWNSHSKSRPNFHNISGRVLITTDLYPQYYYGDVLRISCYLKTPKAIDDFAYDKYLARFNIYSLCYWPEIKVIGHGQGSTILSGIFRMKNSFISSIARVLPEPHASFLSALLVGARKTIPESLLQAFHRTGTTHIIAISGYNITIIVSILLAFAIYIGFKRQYAFWVVTVGIILFVILTGAQASVVRAGIMGFVVLLASQMGRMSQTIGVLVLSAIIMLLINPKILIFDVGFELSFLATIGLIYIRPLFSRLFQRVPEFFAIKESLISTLSAILATLPLILFQFGRLSVVAPFANMLILPAIPWAMLIGFLVGFIGLISISVASFLSFFVWLILSYIIFVVEMFSRFLWASVEIQWFPLWMMVFCYMLIGGVVAVAIVKHKLLERDRNFVISKISCQKQKS